MDSGFRRNDDQEDRNDGKEAESFLKPARHDVMNTDTPARWIGEPPSPVQITAVMFIGVVGILMAGLQPMLLGALAQEGRMTASQLGHAATAELLMMGATAGFAGARFRTENLRIISVVACIAFAAGNYLTQHVSGESITLVRALSGIPQGLMIWIAAAMIARSPTPERWAGIYLTVQTLAQFGVAEFLKDFVLESYGANGGFDSLALLSLVSIFVVTVLPSRFAPLASHGEVGGNPSRRGWIALGATFLYLAFIVGVWVFTEPLSHQAGHVPKIAATAVSISLACQVAGGGLATILAARLRWFPTVLVCSVLNLGCLVVFATLPSPMVYLVTAGVFGFLWLFVLPFLVPMTIEADPTRRAAVLLAGAQLLGGSLGPTMVAFVVTDEDVRGSLYFGAAALLVAVVIMFAVHRRNITHPAA
jgi:hypothetical protein